MEKYDVKRSERKSFASLSHTSQSSIRPKS